MGKGVAYVPHGAADALMGCRDTELLIEGPAGTGKSRAVLEKIHVAAMKYPGIRALIVRKTRESMTESVLVTYEAKVLPKDSPLALGAARKTRQSYEYPNGSTVVVGGMIAHNKDQTAKIMSTEYDMIACFESTELSEADWENLLTRLRNGVMPYQQAMADCNPGPPTHWLNQRANRGQMTRLLSRHKDNPILCDVKSGAWTVRGEAYIATLKRLTGARLLRLLDGKWAASEGGVYPEYDAAVHLIDPFEIPSDWRRIRCIDFGYTNPFVCQWWAIDGDGRMYLYRELYRTRTLVSDFAPEIIELSRGERIEVTIADHDAEDRATLAKENIETLPAVKSVEVGIQAVAERLKRAGDGKPRLFVVNGACADRDLSLMDKKKPTCTAEEFDGYVFPKVAPNKGEKEEPGKVDDHGMDAMRYAVAYVDDILTMPLEVRLIGANNPGPDVRMIGGDQGWQRVWTREI